MSYSKSSNEEILELECSMISTSPFQPRKNFSEEELNELAESIRTIGIIHPPIVRRVLEENKWRYELIAGERRLRAAQIAGLARIKVIVREESIQASAQATLIENIQRVDLNPIEMALAFKRLIEFFGMTQEELSEKIGKKRSTIANYLRLLSLPKKIQFDVSSAKISMGHAKVILSLSDFSDQIQLHDLIVQKNWTVRQAEQACLKIGKNFTKKIENKDHEWNALEQKLQEMFGTKVTITFTKGKKGQIVIDYHSLDDLESLLGKLGLGREEI